MGREMNEAYVTLTGIAVQTVLYLLAGYAMLIRNDTQRNLNTDSLKAEVREMKEELKDLAKVIIEQAVQTTRLDNMTTMVMSIERRVEDLRRGAGYVKGRREIDGEYKD